MRGRPRAYDDDMVTVSIYIPKSIYDRIKEIAKKTGRSRNSIIVEMLRRADPMYATTPQETVSAFQRIDPRVVIPDEIATTPEFQSTITRARQLYRTGRPAQYVLSMAMREIEDLSLRRGYILRYKSLLRAALARIIFSPGNGNKSKKN